MVRAVNGWALSKGERPSHQNYWVFGLFRLSGIRETRKQDFRKLDLFPSSGVGGKTPNQLGPLDRANLNHWTTPVIFTKSPETRQIQREITRKDAIKIVIEHAHAWDYDRKGGRNLCYKPSQQNYVNEHQCKERENSL
jgi:hypothetical protein